MENNSSASSGQGGKFINGFLLGALIGAGIVFLLGTKKGKRLLKAISDEGLGNISNILDKTDTLSDFNEDDEVEDIIPQKSSGAEEEISNGSKASKAKVRRFFKGINKRLN